MSSRTISSRATARKLLFRLCHCYVVLGSLLVLISCGASGEAKLPVKDYDLSVEEAEIFATSDTFSLDAQGLPTLIKDPKAHMGVAFLFVRDSDELIWQHQMGEAQYTINVTARGQLYKGGPELSITIGNKTVTKLFDQETYQTLSFGTFTLRKDTYIRARFINDKWDGTPEKDRNLILSHIYLQPVGDAEPEPEEPTEPEPTEPETPPTPAPGSISFMSNAYKPYTGLLLNPERGFHYIEWITGDDASTNFEGVRDEGYTLVRTHIGLDEFKDGPISEERLEEIRTGFAAVRRAGLKALPVISYIFPTDGTYGSGDAPLNVVRQHLDQLEPVFEEYKDIIALVQGGFIGPWGEWHSSSNDLHEEPALSQVYEKILEVLPKDRMLQVRYVNQLRELPEQKVNTATAYSANNAARTGMKNMCFLVDETDGGTYWNIETDKDYLAEVSQFVPVGGETCSIAIGSSNRYDCPTSQAELELFHWSFMSPDGVPFDGWRREGCYETIRDRLGYRFELQTSSIQRDVRAGSPLITRFVVRNTGYAAPFNPRGLALVLRNQRTGTTYTMPIWQDRSATLDPRKWYREAGNITVAASPIVPSNVPTGTYDVLLSLPDPEPGLSSRSEYSIRFANQDVWEEDTGLNLLAEGVRVKQ